MSDGHLNFCKECRSQKDREYRERNADRLREQRKQWGGENRELKRKLDAEYRAKNADKLRAKHRDYYLKNREKIKERTRQWSAQNAERKREVDAAYRRENRERLREWHREHGKTPERRAATNHKNKMRQTLKKTNGLKLTAEQVDARMSYFGYRCWMCGEPGVEVDHVKPITKGGAHMLCNLRPACRSCNSSKNNKWPFETKIAP